MAILVKICGIQTVEDIEIMNQTRPDFIGFVFATSKRQITKKQAKKLRESLDAGIRVVGVFVNTNQAEIIDIVKYGIIDYIQLHGFEDENYIKALKLKVDIPIIKAICVQDTLGNIENTADFLLLDGEKPGSGAVFDWSLVGLITQRFFLAGGLNSTTIENALDKLEPYGVDISSGVEEAGRKDLVKTREFINKVRNRRGVDFL
ncbi:N-(5'-phosphoribosyl)anthranilate isomerase [Erysipelotrichaceae bacterium]|nr:N-(5'-phosphoribosyl)anthranilate isomerase [Erysipelotrichaceae bacterium]